MKRIDWVPNGVILLSITFLMGYDFFPKLNGFLYIPKPIVIGLLLLVLLFGLFMTRFQDDYSSKSNFRWQVAFMSYLLFLIIVFSLFGGVSQVGISLSSPALWIVLVISVFEIIQEYKKLKTAHSAS